MIKKNRYIKTAALAAFLALLIFSTDFKGNLTVRTAAAATGAQPRFSFTVKTARDIAAEWPDEAKEAADSMLRKYGAPDGITGSLLIWHDKGPWQEITVKKDGIDHRFPSPHKDTLEQKVAYEVPVEDLTAALSRRGPAAPWPQEARARP